VSESDGDRGEWESTLAMTVSERCTVLRSCVVLGETASTQDEARHRLLSRGECGAIVAWRQTAGRGRQGRAWADTAQDGVAVTFVMPDRRSEVLVMLAAVAACRSIERAIADTPGNDEPLAIGIKWPNDLVCRGRKLGGILIERPASGHRLTLVGIGINVSQRSFPEHLADVATSVSLSGGHATRLAILTRLVCAIDRFAATGDDELLPTLLADYLQRDALRGAEATFATATGEVAGRVMQAHPLEGITVMTVDGQRILPRATTSVVSWRPTGIG
jgi:BirA family biotin operon repressor/biotin-[acetyl-CoA-carboxylase] ligase